MGLGCSDGQSPVAVGVEHAASGGANKLVVYSSRNEHLIQPVFERYTAVSGVTIDYATDKAGVLIERIKAEGQNTRSDVLLTVDAGTLGFAANQGLFQPLNSKRVTQVVPAYARGANDLWVGLSLRARTLVYSTERVEPGELSTYAALADATWRGRLCLRTAKKVYNQSLVAMLISQYG
ncbi:MAG: extracellular solute-binding protein, partial [Pseudomonadales bacterium]|nr:extracellular solute-binding protein [Pseudomonadales bacterium]